MKGRRFGHQEIIGLEPLRNGFMTLVDSGPLRHTPCLDFLRRELGPNRTEVVLRFDNTYRRPFPVPARLFGLPG